MHARAAAAVDAAVGVRRQCDLDAVEYVCAGPDLPVEDVLDLVGKLQDQSLLVREETAAGVRFRMLETVRVYEAGRLESPGDARRLRRRHRDWYMGLATWCELDWFSPRRQEVAALVEAELPNLRLALECCLAEPDEVHLGQYLAGTLWSRGPGRAGAAGPGERGGAARVSRQAGRGGAGGGPRVPRRAAAAADQPQSASSRGPRAGRARERENPPPPGGDGGLTSQ